jgi:O-antigen ligase
MNFMFADPIASFLFIVISTLLGFSLWIVLFRNPTGPIVLILAVFVVYLSFDQNALSFEFGQYSINILDILAALLISLVVGRLILHPKLITKEFLVVILLGLLLLISWLRGTFQYNLAASTNAFRTYLFFYATLLYTLTLDYSKELFRKVTFWLSVICVVLIVTVVIRWILVGLGKISSTDWLAPNGSMVRVISATSTLLLLQIMLCIYYSKNKGKQNIISYIAIIIITCTIVFLQQRTVWVALFVSLLLAIALKTKHKSVILLGSLLVIVLILSFFAWNNLSIDDLQGTSLDLHNLNWRVLGWQQLLNPDRFLTPLDYFIGQPFGTSFARYILDSIYETTVSPHNFYVQTFLNIGGIGLFLLLYLYAMVLKTLWKSRSENCSQLFIILLTTQLIFYLTYAPNFEQGLFFGLAIIYALQKKVQSNSGMPIFKNEAIRKIDNLDQSGMLQK